MSTPTTATNGDSAATTTATAIDAGNKTATNNKYDRQLRLWGAAGQQALQQESILFAIRGGTAVGTETLKNLVLPGIRHIWILDDHATGATDGTFATNFFLSNNKNSTPPKCRAQTSCELLQELNPDVKCDWKHVEEPGMFLSQLQTLIASIEQAAATTTKTTRFLILTCDLELCHLLDVAKWAHGKSITLVNVTAYGLAGSVRLQTPPSFAILNPKPAARIPDLRLVKPFDSLRKYMDSKSLDTMTDFDLKHLPYPVLLYKAGQKWKLEHQNALPKSWDEKQEFVSLLKRFSRRKSPSEALELNIDEAVRHAYLAYTDPYFLDPQEFLDQKVKGLPWGAEDLVLATTMHQYLQQSNGQPPLLGTSSWPDMVSSTQTYLELQNVYHDQAQIELNTFRTMLAKTTSSLDSARVDAYCQNITLVDCWNMRSLEKEYLLPSEAPKHPQDILEEVQMQWMDVSLEAPIVWYMGVKACNIFQNQHGYYPGTRNEKYEEDVAPLQQVYSMLLQQYGLEGADVSMIQQVCQEVCRWGQAEIHTICSIVGGVASQEIVKCLTGQYIPIHHTWIYDGIHSTSATLQV